MHKARDDLTNKKPAIHRVQQDNACFNVQHIVTEGFGLKEFGNNNPASASDCPGKCITNWKTFKELQSLRTRICTTFNSKNSAFGHTVDTRVSCHSHSKRTFLPTEFTVRFL